MMQVMEFADAGKSLLEHLDIKQCCDRLGVVTKDGSRAAHFEHTVAVTSEGPRILTKAGAALLR